MEPLTRRPSPGAPGVVDVPVMRIGFSELVPFQPFGLKESMHAADRALDGLLAALDEGSSEVREVRAQLQAVERLARRVDSARLRLVAAAERGQVAEMTGSTDTGAWVARTTRADRRPAASAVHLAKALSPPALEGGEAAAPALVATGAALDRGDLSAAHASVIARALDDLPEWVTADQRHECEAELVRCAENRSPGQLRQVARRVLAQVEPDESVVDAHEEAVVRDEEESADERATFWIKDNHDGTMTGQFTVPWASGAILRKVIDAITAPRRRRHDRGPGGAAGLQTDEDRPAVDLPGDERWAALDWQQRRGLAFADLLTRIPTDHLHGKVAATLLVTTRLEDLQAKLTEDPLHRAKAASTECGEVMSAGAARRLACGAGLVPGVLGTDSVPLDLGRATRTFNESQRVALSRRYGECAEVDCDRPYAWCELHHLTAWRDGGPTDLANAAPLCGRHHRMIESDRWSHRVIRRVDKSVEILFTRRC